MLTMKKKKLSRMPSRRSTSKPTIASSTTHRLSEIRHDLDDMTVGGASSGEWEHNKEHSHIRLRNGVKWPYTGTTWPRLTPWRHRPGSKRQSSDCVCEGVPCREEQESRSGMGYPPQGVGNGKRPPLGRPFFYYYRSTVCRRARRPPQYYNHFAGRGSTTWSHTPDNCRCRQGHVDPGRSPWLVRQHRHQPSPPPCRHQGYFGLTRAGKHGEVGLPSAPTAHGVFSAATKAQGAKLTCLVLEAAIARRNSAPTNSFRNAALSAA